MLRIIYTGSRYWTDAMTVQYAIREDHKLDPNFTMKVGDAVGLDDIAGGIWRALGGRVEIHQAHWRRYGNEAGKIRNTGMVTTGADLCRGFITGKSWGTYHCLRTAHENGVPVIVYENQSDDPDLIHVQRYDNWEEWVRGTSMPLNEKRLYS